LSSTAVSSKGSLSFASSSASSLSSSTMVEEDNGGFDYDEEREERIRTGRKELTESNWDQKLTRAEKEFAETLVRLVAYKIGRGEVVDGLFKATNRQMMDLMTARYGTEFVVLDGEGCPRQFRRWKCAFVTKVAGGRTLEARKVELVEMVSEGRPGKPSVYRLTGLLAAFPELRTHDSGCAIYEQSAGVVHVRNPSRLRSSVTRPARTPAADARYRSFRAAAGVPGAPPGSSPSPRTPDRTARPVATPPKGECRSETGSISPPRCARPRPEAPTRATGRPFEYGPRAVPGVLTAGHPSRPRSAIGRDGRGRLERTGGLVSAPSGAFDGIVAWSTGRLSRASRPAPPDATASTDSKRPVRWQKWGRVAGAKTPARSGYAGRAPPSRAWGR
jgi:hypothetical protein